MFLQPVVTVVNGVEQEGADLSLLAKSTPIFESSDFGPNSGVNENVLSWHQIPINVKFNDNEFLVALNTADKDVFTLPSRGIVHHVRARVITPFSGPGITSADVRIGIAGTPAKYMVYTDIFTGATQDLIGVDLGPGILENFTASTTIIAGLQVGPGSADLDDLAAGELGIYIQYARLPATLS